MGNFKVRVNSEAESREVQDLLVKMGYHARANWSERNPIHESIQAWSDGEFTFSLNHNQVPAGFKELTLAELRAMVKPSLNDQYAEIEQVRQSAYDKQEGGSHYKKLAIQPMEYSLANGLDAGQHTVIKYVTRFKDKGGIEDLHKAKHTIDLLIEHYYGVEK